MYKISVPISLNTINDESLPEYLKQIKECKADRVFLCGLGLICDKTSRLYTETDKIKKVINFFKNEGLEVGLWICSLRHGSAIVPTFMPTVENNYVQIEGVRGDTIRDTNCPLDENFINDYIEGLKKVASLHPDMIMLDDDYRINTRPASYYMGCFCPLHLKEYYKRIGEEIPRDEIEKLIFTGGKNKYRTEYMKLLADSMLDFSKTLRNAVDEIDKTIRLGYCLVYEVWDYGETDAIEIAKALAGDTEPFCRTAGAPYWNNNILSIIESTRMQFEWFENSGVEAFAEGDTYPRPRYNISSKVLELFDLALTANGKGDGILTYLFEYNQKYDYETGYIKRHINNLPLKQSLRELFSNKTHTGIRVFNVKHKANNWDLPDEPEQGIAHKIHPDSIPSPSEILSSNAIPTAYTKTDYPVFIAGENAKYISEEDLQNGAILDVKAAKILMERGIDTGLISEEKSECNKEYFIKSDDAILNIAGQHLRKIKCSEKAEILSLFMPDETPSAYCYENSDGLRFFVLAFDWYFTNTNVFWRNFANSYYRQEQMINAIEWLGKKKIPAVCLKNPNLYMLVSKNNDSMSVLLLNIYLDDILEPEITLDKEYSQIKFVNCTGTLKGSKVVLSDLQAYGIAAFEVK